MIQNYLRKGGSINYSLEINPQNIQPHVDIEHDILDKKNGLFTFILRVNNGVIVDYSVIENVDIEKDYVAVSGTFITKSTTPLNNGK
jgi:hypothetical protein